MIDADSFMKNSPFQITHSNDVAYNLNNTTPDLLKFQLQDQYRNKITDLKNNHLDLPNLSLFNSQFLQGSFNNHLQSSVSQIPSLVSTPTNSSTFNNSSSSSRSASDSSTINNANTPPPASATTAATTVSSTPIPSNANYLNLKILIENSVFDTSKINKDAILSLHNVNNLKSLITDKKDLKSYLTSRISISNQFTNKLIRNQHQVDLDASLLIKILKSNQALQNQLESINQELDYLTNRLNNHNLACLVLGYVEDVHLTSSSSSLSFSPLATSANPASVHSSLASDSAPRFLDASSINKSLEKLFAHIAAIAAQRNITLPSPPSPSAASSNSTVAPTEPVDAKVKWIQDCMDAILNHHSFAATANTTENASGLEPATPTRLASPSSSSSPNTRNRQNSIANSSVHDSSFLSASPYRSYNSSNDKNIAEYKTALADLRFSHHYLLKEYEHSKENSTKLIQEYRKKIGVMERELGSLKDKSSISSSAATAATPATAILEKNQPNEDVDDYDNVIAKDKEIARLRKELNSMKIDNLGNQTSTSSLASISSSSSPLQPYHHALSPPTTGHLTPKDERNDPMSNSSLPIMHHQGGSVATNGSNGTGTAQTTSNGMLRKEFKRIVGDMQDQYELELGEERFKRRQLQEQLAKLQISN